MGDLILVINAGSSSLKFSIFEAEGTGDPDLLVGGQVEGIDGTPHFKAKTADGRVLEDTRFEAPFGHEGAMQRIGTWTKTHLGDRRIAVIGHRVVHGGTRFEAPVLVDDRVMTALGNLVPLAPLHQPHNLRAIEAMALAYPGVPQVACFDTAFHRGHPWVADTFALPRDCYEKGLRRYGFHGNSYEYIARELNRIAPDLATGRVVVAHLGNGASCCALKAGRSLDSTMSFTALDGLPMGTRCGQIDPGVLLHLMDDLGMSSAEIADLIYRQSGLKGLSGISNDMRDLEASEAPEAAQAIAYFAYRIRREVAALAAAMEGIDGLIFTAGIGEHSQRLRREVCEGLGWLGLELDPAANERHAAVISTSASRVEVRVTPTDEERMIALHALQVSGLRPRSSDQ